MSYSWARGLSVFKEAATRSEILLSLPKKLLFSYHKKDIRGYNDIFALTSNMFLFHFERKGTNKLAFETFPFMSSVNFTWKADLRFVVMKFKLCSFGQQPKRVLYLKGAAARVLRN